MNAETLLVTINDDPSYAWCRNDQNRGVLEEKVGKVTATIKSNLTAQQFVLTDPRVVRNTMSHEEWASGLFALNALKESVTALTKQTRMIISMHNKRAES